MLFKINSDNPEMRKVGQIAEILRDGGVIIYPTDSVYALGCDVDQPKAIERICQLRGLKPEKAMLSLICKDISQASEYAAQIDNEIFKLMKEHLPGPYTFILKASRSVPKKFVNRKKTIGVRIPQNNIALAIVEELGRPLMTASLKSDDQILEYFTDPETIYENYKKRVDAEIDGGIGGNEPSTIIDCSGDEPVMIREGAGEI